MSHDLEVSPWWGVLLSLRCQMDFWAPTRAGSEVGEEKGKLWKNYCTTSRKPDAFRSGKQLRQRSKV